MLPVPYDKKKNDNDEELECYIDGKYDIDD